MREKSVPYAYGTERYGRSGREKQIPRCARNDKLSWDEEIVAKVASEKGKDLK